jgi:hypothetical protein
MPSNPFPTAEQVLEQSTRTFRHAVLSEAAAKVMAGEMTEDEYYDLKEELG